MMMPGDVLERKNKDCQSCMTTTSKGGEPAGVRLSAVFGNTF